MWQCVVNKYIYIYNYFVLLEDGDNIDTSIDKCLYVKQILNYKINSVSLKNKI